MQLDNVTIYLSEHDEGFIARYVDRAGRTIWSELYDRVEDARIAYADYAAAGKYSEDLGAQARADRYWWV